MIDTKTDKGKMQEIDKALNQLKESHQTYIETWREARFNTSDSSGDEFTKETSAHGNNLLGRKVSS